MGQHKIGPVVMVLPVLSLALGLVWFHRHPQVEVPGAPPRVSDPNSEVVVWRGTSASPGYGELWVEVQPLHGDVERQEFEAESLRARFGLGTGEPLRVRLDWVLDGESRDPGPPALRGESLRIVEGGELLASPIQGVLDPEPSAGVHDPVRALLSAPAGGLSPGRGVDLVFWGRRPGDDARLVDVTLDAGAPTGAPTEASQAGILGHGGVALGRTERRLMDFPPSLARFDAKDVSALGKMEAPGASTPTDRLDPSDSDPHERGPLESGHARPGTEGSGGELPVDASGGDGR